MKLVRDHSAGARAVYVRCLHCGQSVRLADAVVDTEGPAFEAYYHERCLPEGHPVVRQCSTFGCTRSECQVRPGEER